MLLEFDHIHTISLEDRAVSVKIDLNRGKVLQLLLDRFVPSRKHAGAQTMGRCPEPQIEACGLELVGFDFYR